MAPWKEFVEAGICAEGFDLHLQGHDHDLEWIKPQPQCGDTHFIVSGAADSPRNFGDAERNEVFYQQDQVLGFFWFEVTQGSLLGAVYQLDGDGRPQVAFEKTSIRGRDRVPAGAGRSLRRRYRPRRTPSTAGR